MSSEGYDDLDLHAEVANAAHQQGLHVLEICETYADFRPRLLRRPDDAIHPSVLGHHLAARALHALLRDRTPSLTAAAP